MSFFTGISFFKSNTNKATGVVHIAKHKFSEIQSGNSVTKIVKQKPKAPISNANTSAGRSGGQSSGCNEGARVSSSSSSKNYIKRGGGAGGYKKPKRHGRKN